MGQKTTKLKRSISLSKKSYRKALETFMSIVTVHPYCTRNSCCNIMPRHTSSACAKEEIGASIGLGTGCAKFAYNGQ